MSNEKEKKDGQVIPQFINLTDSVVMDKSSRTKVRVQVMREYHRQRAQKQESPREPIQISPKPPLSAEAQTLKFRFGQEKILKPWVPVKSQGSKQKDFKNTDASDDAQKRRKVSGQGRPGDARLFHRRTSSYFAELKLGTASRAGEEFENGFISGNQETEQWLDHLALSLQGPSLCQTPASGSLDPFSAMSLLITPRTQLLLHHYFSDRLYSAWLMMPMRKGMLSLALHDTALFHTFMSHYIARYNIRYQTGDPAESMYHRTQAISIVNEKLANPNYALSDATIAAAANMAVYESSNGRESSMLVHLNGLVGMVNMRGGILQGGFHPNVQRLLVWTDLHCALALSQKPRFPPVDMPLTHAPESITLTPNFGIAAATEFHTFEGISGLDQVLSDIRHLSRTMQIIWTGSAPPQENIWYSDRIYYFQRSLYEIIHRPASENQDLDVEGSIAAVIYCCNCLRDIPLSFRALSTAVTRLKRSLESFPKELLLSQDSRLHMRLFWILGLGGAASEGKLERSWFVEEFKTIRDILGVQSWDVARSMLESVLWHPELDGFGKRFWDEAISQPRAGIGV